MPADRRSRVAQARASGRHSVVNYISGGSGGPGGDGHGNSTGGAGGPGMGPSLGFDISVGHLNLHNNVHLDDDFESGRRHRPNAVGRDALHDPRSAPLIQQNIHQHGDRGIDILHRTVALAAMHDSVESFPQPKCHPETRTKILEDLREWALSTNPKTTILWLYGPAGAGKSAIMQTLAGQLQDAGRLGGCFFFKRSHASRGNGKTLFATIAYQLALGVPWLRTPISQTAENDPSIVVRSIETQMQKLISEPCRAYGNRDPVAILIDGLDECEGHNIQQGILRTIRNSSSKHPISLRFIIASRPEPHIREVFDSRFYFGLYHRFNVEQSFADVRKYLWDEFSRIHREYHDTMAGIPSPWPSPYVLEELVSKSSGHFIYASTIIKFIDDKHYRPTERLAVVQDGNRIGPESVFEPLDQLYMTILRSAPRQSQLIPILCAIANFGLKAGLIDRLFGLPYGDTRLILRGLHSMLDIPSNNEDTISSHHASFLDFLNNPTRSQNFYVGSLHHRMDLARSLLIFCGGQYQERWIFYGPRSPRYKFIPFITSLPPCAELCLLIGPMNPEYIFDIMFDLESMLSWLKKIPSAHRDLIQLWEDYAYMRWFEKGIEGQSRSPQIFSAQNILSPSPELLRVLVSLSFIVGGLRWTRSLLDITWNELRTLICGFRTRSARDEVLPGSAVQLSSPGEVYPWAFRDVALRFIRRMAKNFTNNDDALGIEDEFVKYDLQELQSLVRLSPPCLELYGELWSIPPLLIRLHPGRGEFIYHVSKWLESFPDSTLDLIAFWRQTMYDERSSADISPVAESAEQRWEQEWRMEVNGWNYTITRLHLPDDLKIPL